MSKRPIKVQYAMNMCAVDPDEMPEGGIIAVPADPPGTWYAVCADATLAQTLKGTPEHNKSGYPVKKVKFGNTHDQPDLARGLEKAGFEAQFVNSPPWLD